MRYVDIDMLNPPEDFADRAKEAKNAVAAGAEIDDYSAVWRDAKPALEQECGKKCWYCESIATRSDNAVDHFRPKGRVNEAPDHGGYRWLAFEWKNFRYACTFCNSRRRDHATGGAGGKADRFPLLEEDTRVYAEPGDCGLEKIALLDPCDPDDFRLLGCRWEDGKSCPAINDEEVEHRVKVTVDIFHLNYTNLRNDRRRVCAEFQAALDRVKAIYARGDLTNPEVIASFKSAIKEAKRFLDRRSPFSGELHYVLRAFRSAEHPWMDQLPEF